MGVQREKSFRPRWSQQGRRDFLLSLSLSLTVSIVRIVRIKNRSACHVCRPGSAAIDSAVGASLHMPQQAANNNVHCPDMFCTLTTQSMLCLRPADSSAAADPAPAVPRPSAQRA